MKQSSQYSYSARCNILYNRDTIIDAIVKHANTTLAIPFVFEPIIIGEDVYCDGGLLDNLPIENIINYENDDDNKLEKENQFLKNLTLS